MNILEKEIEDIIYDNVENNNDILKERGLKLYPNVIRQLDLGSYGKSDLICYAISRYKSSGAYINIQIVELKKDLIDINTYMQSCRYRKGILKLLSHHYNLQRTYIDFQHILIGKEIQRNGDFCFVIDSIDDLSVYTYSIDLVKGITFHNVSGFYQTNEMVGCFSKQVKESIKDYIEYNVATNYVIQQPNGSEIFK